MSPARALQKAVFETLRADAGVSAWVDDRVFDEPPTSKRARFPRITFGPGQSLDADSDCIGAEDQVLQIDIWDRSEGRKGPCRDMTEAVKKALHRRHLVADPPFAILAARVLDTQVLDDPDGVTAHGIVTLQATVETGD